MKKLTDILNESLLDDEDDLLSSSYKGAIIDGLKKIGTKFDEKQLTIDENNYINIAGGGYNIKVDSEQKLPDILRLCKFGDVVGPIYIKVNDGILSDRLLPKSCTHAVNIQVGAPVSGSHVKINISNNVLKGVKILNIKTLDTVESININLKHKIDKLRLSSSYDSWDYLEDIKLPKIKFIELDDNYTVIFAHKFLESLGHDRKNIMQI